MTTVYQKTHPPETLTWLNQALDGIDQSGPIIAPDGFVYLIHLDTPIGRPQTAKQRAQYGLPPRQSDHYTPRAQHYLGWTTDLPARIQAHRLGHGSKFLAAARRQGVSFQVIRVWLGGPDVETRLKARKNNRKLCPHCCDTAVHLKIDELPTAAIPSLLIPF